MTPLLEVDGLQKRFGGLVAVKDISFSLRGGTREILRGIIARGLGLQPFPGKAGTEPLATEVLADTDGAENVVAPSLASPSQL